jgi:hypothetical protein
MAKDFEYSFMYLLSFLLRTVSSIHFQFINWIICSSVYFVFLYIVDINPLFVE